MVLVVAQPLEIVLFLKGQVDPVLKVEEHRLAVQALLLEVVQVRQDQGDLVYPEVHLVAFHVQWVEVPALVGLEALEAYRGLEVVHWALVVPASVGLVEVLFLEHVRGIDL